VGTKLPPPKSPREIGYAAQRRAAWSLLVAYGLVWSVVGAFLSEWWHWAVAFALNLLWSRVWVTELGLRLWRAERVAMKDLANR